jgi:hypothetical protein
MRSVRFTIPLVTVCIVLIGVTSLPAQAARRHGREFPVPTPSGYPYGITAGPDGMT